MLAVGVTVQHMLQAATILNGVFSVVFCSPAPYRDVNPKPSMHG